MRVCAGISYQVESIDKQQNAFYDNPIVVRHFLSLNILS